MAGETDPDTGYVVDLGELKKVIHAKVVSVCDHKNLNLDVDFLQGIIPSAENLARAFFLRLEKDIDRITPHGKLFSVRLYETERNIAEYRED